MRGLSLLFLLGIAFALTGGALAVALRPSGTTVRGPSDLERAKSAYADRDFAKAEALLAGIDSPDADLLRAKIKRETGRLAEARDLFAKLVKADPKNADAVQGLAQVYSALHQDELAIPLWRRLCDLRPKDAYAWRELALAQVRTKDSLGAMTAIQKSLELDPGQQDLQLLLADVARPDFEPAAAPRRTPLAGTRTPVLPDPERYFPQPSWRKP